VVAVVAPNLERFVPLMVKATALVCSIGLAHQAAEMTWDFIDPVFVELPKPEVIKSSGANTFQSTLNNGRVALADLHLLGIADAEPDNTPQENVAAPETRLNFELKGILAGGEDGSSAIIAERGGAGEYFKVGDLVFSRARLAGVNADHVLLNNRGSLEKLAFDEDAAGLIQRGSKVSVPNKPSQSSGNRFENRLKEISTPEEFVDFARSELLEDPQQALNNLGVEASGEGYRVTNKAGMLMGLGMQAGDVIVSINGQSLGNIEQDRGLIDQVYADGQARIEVQRGSRRFIINHSFR
jgi:general secretion pathway protein C